MPSLLEIPRFQFDENDVERMLAAEVLDEDAPVELLDGELCLMSPQNARHAALADLVRRLLEGHYGEGWFVRSHSPLRIDSKTLPEPDLAVVRGEPRDYLDRHPTSADVALVVEIAATAPARDRAKAAIYARGGVACHWLLDLPAQRLEVRTDPGSSDYVRVRVLGPGNDATLPVTRRSVAVSELFGL